MNIIIFDTETLGFQSQDLLNIGYRIVDIDIFNKNYQILCERDMVDMNLYRAIKKIANHKGCLEQDIPNILTSNFLPQSKMTIYDNLIETKRIERHSVKKMFEIMAKDIAKYSVVFGYAYNCAFDIDKFAKTSQKYGLINPIDNLVVFDIWAYAVNYICNTKEYIAWAKTNEIFTQKEIYLSTSVESVTKYLNQDLDFVEEHTALSDTKWEINILLECLRLGCDITKVEKRGKFIPSGKKLHKKIITPDGEVIEFDYTRQVTRTETEHHYE